MESKKMRLTENGIGEKMVEFVYFLKMAPSRQDWEWFRRRFMIKKNTLEKQLWFLRDSNVLPYNSDLPFIDALERYRENHKEDSSHSRKVTLKEKMAIKALKDLTSGKTCPRNVRDKIFEAMTESRSPERSMDRILKPLGKNFEL